MAKQAKQPSSIHSQILALLKNAPTGLDVVEIRRGIPGIGLQQHLDKRIRELRERHNIPREKILGRWVYIYRGEKSKPATDDGKINAKLRAEVLHKARGRCQMCGRTVETDDVKLQIDHKIPRTWGGATALENLWALCQLCNGGKRDYFSSFDDDEMRSIMSKESVYERLAQTLKLHSPSATPSWLLEFIANFDDFQEDWQKRLRELRYLGMKITATRSKNSSGKVQSSYLLHHWIDLPNDHKFLIKEHERNTKKLNSNKSS